MHALVGESRRVSTDPVAPEDGIWPAVPNGHRRNRLATLHFGECLESLQLPKRRNRSKPLDSCLLHGSVRVESLGDSAADKRRTFLSEQFHEALLLLYERVDPPGLPVQEGGYGPLLAEWRKRKNAIADGTTREAEACYSICRNRELVAHSRSHESSCQIASVTNSVRPDLGQMVSAYDARQILRDHCGNRYVHAIFRVLGDKNVASSERKTFCLVLGGSSQHEIDAGGDLVVVVHVHVVAERDRHLPRHRFLVHVAELHFRDCLQPPHLPVRRNLPQPLHPRIPVLRIPLEPQLHVSNPHSTRFRHGHSPLPAPVERGLHGPPAGQSISNATSRTTLAHTGPRKLRATPPASAKVSGR